MSDADNAGSNDQTDDANHCTSKPIDINVPSGSKSKSGSLLGKFDINTLGCNFSKFTIFVTRISK